jgi:hypothetical protein
MPPKTENRMLGWLVLEDQIHDWLDSDISNYFLVLVLAANTGILFLGHNEVPSHRQSVLPNDLLFSTVIVERSEQTKLLSIKFLLQPQKVNPIDCLTQYYRIMQSFYSTSTYPPVLGTAAQKRRSSYLSDLIHLNST